MENYAIYCTTNQTEKAFELGAPIDEMPMCMYGENETPKYVHKNKWNRECFCYCPTAEQMIGWIRKEHKIHPRIDCEGAINYVVQLQFIDSSKNIDIENRNYKGIIGHKGYPTTEEATLAAIDAALDYLLKQNEQI